MHKKFNLKVYYYTNGIAYRCLSFLVFRRYITVHVFCKICRKYSSNANCMLMIGQCIGWLSVCFANFIDFENPIDFCLEIVVWKLEPFLLEQNVNCMENDSSFGMQDEPLTVKFSNLGGLFEKYIRNSGILCVGATPIILTAWSHTFRENSTLNILLF